MHHRRRNRGRFKKKVQIVTKTVTSPFKRTNMKQLTKEKLKKKTGLNLSREAQKRLKNI